MANKKITDLVDIGTPASGDLLEIVDISEGVSKRVAVSALGGTPTLQEVLDNNHDLVDENNFQGTDAGDGNTGINVNAFGQVSSQNNSGNYINAFGLEAGYENTGDNLNAFGSFAGSYNTEENLNAFGTASGEGNSGKHVNALGNSAGGSNTYDNVNLFGENAQADEDGQTVLSKDGTIMARISTADLTDTQKYNLPDASGTIALTTDIPPPITIDATPTDGSANAVSSNGVFDALALKQDTLVSATNIKTINGSSVLGSGDLVVGGSTSLAIGTTPITSGTIGRVLFEGTGNVLQESGNLLFDESISRFTLRSSTQGGRGFVQEEYGNSQGAASMLFQKSRGTFASPVNVNAQDLVGAFVFNARVGAAFTSDRCLFGANMASTTGIGMYFIAGSTDQNYIPDLYIHQTGNIAIGSTQNVLVGGITDAGFKLDVNGTARVQGDFTISDTRNIILATGTGTKIGTATTQKLSLWNATPNVQPTTAITAGAFVSNTSAILNDTATFDGYTIGQVVAALRRIGALA